MLISLWKVTSKEKKERTKAVTNKETNDRVIILLKKRKINEQKSDNKKLQAGAETKLCYFLGEFFRFSDDTR